MNYKPPAPVVLFVYNRPNHTKYTLEALADNPLARDTSLYIFSDGSASKDDLDNVLRVRSICRNAKGFKSITVVENNGNLGLANSIIKGVTEVVNCYGKVIVLEDDIVTSPVFLEYMNDALDYYELNQNVWHISGWNYPIDADGLPETYFWKTMNCWGWGTWKDRWDCFEKDPDKLIKTWSRKDIHKFNLKGNYNFWEQIVRNANGDINTWAIFWYATIFINNGYCLNPTKTLVNNIGHDGSGINCSAEDLYRGNLSLITPALPKSVSVNNEVLEEVIKFYKSLKPSLYHRIKNKLVRLFS